MTPRERTLFEEAAGGHISGSPDEAAAELKGLAGRTGADEFLVTTSTYDLGELLESHRLLAGALAGS
jgi:alkanesulfonate monooxygenase SsuD/methylene tetrahydromethanopterin reductase-like flavin-dependent oxidoreductase (luciferase family)